jgi:hypothetical protein
MEVLVGILCPNYLAKSKTPVRQNGTTTEKTTIKFLIKTGRRKNLI